MNPIYQFLKDNKLTTKDEKTFEKDYSDRTKAKELHSFFSTNKLTEKDFDSFYNEYFKKKEVSQPVSPSGGTLGTSEAPLEEKPPKGFEGLKPAKVQPIQVFEEKGVGEATMLTRKMERAQKQAISGTGVRLPAAPKAVAAERGMQRAVEPMVEKPTRPETQSWLSNTVSALDRGFYKNLIGNPIKGLATVVQYGTKAMTGGKVKEGPVSDALMRFGNWFNDAIDEVAPQDPEFKNSLSDQFVQALGQVGSMILTGGIGAGGKGAAIAEQAIPKAIAEKGIMGKLAPMVSAVKAGAKELTSELVSPTAVSAGLSMGQSEFERAKQAGASDDQAFEAFYKNAVVGSVLEKVPVMQFFKRFNNATQGGIVNYLKTKGAAGLKGGVEEFTTEILQQLYSNKTAQDIYNINQNIFEGLTESGVIGFGVGFLLNAMGARAKVLRNEGKEAEAKVVEDQVKEFESRTSKGAAAEPQVPPAPSVAPEMAQYTMEAPRLAGEPEQISKPIELSVEPAPKKEISEKSEQKLKEIWNNIGNNRGRSALEDGWAESFGHIQEALSVGGQNYQAHGMGKSGFPAALRDLFDLFKKGIDPSRGGGQLYTAPLVISQENKAAASAIGTAGGTAYTDGAFVLVTRKGVNGIRSIDDIGGILVNNGLTDINPEILTELRKAFPNLVIESYQNTKKLVEQLNQKAEQSSVEAAPQVPATEEKTYRVEYFDPETRKMTHQMFATEAEGEAFKKTLTREQTSQGVRSYFEKAPAKGVGEVVTEAAPQAPATPEAQKESIQNVIKQEGLDISPNQLDRLYDEAVKGGGKIEDSQIRKILNVGYLKAIRIAEDINDLGVGEVTPKAAPEAALEAQKADIEKTKYGTISGSIPLSEALPNGVYVDLGNGLFAYADKNDKIAAIVDRDNNYIVSKSFWNAKEGKWQLPNKANLADDAKRLGVNQNEYIQKYQDAINALNEKGVGEKVAAPQVPAAPIVEDKKADIERRRQDELSKYPNLYKNAKTKEELQKVVKDWLDLDIFSQQDSTPNVRSALYTPGGFERGKELFLEERKQNIDDFNNRLNAKYDAELASLGVGEVAPEAAPQVPAAPIEEELPFGETAPREAVETKEEKNLTRRALNLEVSTPRGEVLQYFISGGKISPEALTEFFGKERRMGMGKIRVEERRSRTSLTNKNAPSIEALAEKIAGTDRLDQVQEYREAIEEALLNHSGTKTMAEELVRDYDVEFAEMKRAAELEELGQEIEAEVQAFVSQIPPAQQEEIMRVLDKFRDNDGFIDWRKIDDEIKFGFEPVLLDLSEPSRKIIDNAIKQFQETGRVGRISPEALPTEAKAGDAARSLAERIRAGKINKEGFRASTGFDVVWDAALEIVASSLETGASIADAVQDGLKYIRTTDWYKNLTDKKDFEDKFTNRLNEEYNAIQVGGPEEVPVGEAPKGRGKVEPGVPPTKPPKALKKGKTQSEKDLDKLANNVPDTGKVDEYLSKGTIEKYTGETPENSQARGVQELRIALEHGDKIIEKAKEAFGKDYVEKTLEYIEESTAATSNKALMYVSLENALGKEKLTNPDRAGEITKLQALVYAKSQEFAREASLALNYQKLRKVAQVGYDTSEITDTFFSSQELKDKRTLNKAIEANPDEVNAMEDEREAERIYSQEELEKKVEQGVRAEVDKLFQQLPKKSKSKAEKAITVLAKWRKQIRGRAYDATLGIPASVIDTGLAVIENAIKIGVSVEKAIDLGIKKIKEGLKGKPWPKENDFRKDMLDFYKQEGIDTKSELPSTNKQYIKEALIKQGFGRKTTIKGEEREVLDWRKLAGEAGTVERIRENVEEAMRNEGFTEQEIKDAQAEYEQEYVDLRQSIIEKAQNELARRNKTTVTSAQKSAAKRLAELYTYGLFEKNYDEYEVAMNKALGVKVSEKTFNEAKKIAEAIKSIYASTFQGVRLSDVSAKSALEKLSDNVRVLVYEQSKKQGSTPFKLASLVRRYLDFTQTMILVSFKNATENFSSGLQQKLIDKLFISMGKQTTPELIKERRRLMKDVYKDMILNGGIGYGKVETRFVNRRHLDDYVNKLSDNQLYHGIASVVTGKATLNAMDAMFKAGLTEARFTSNLIRILTDKSNPNKISKDEALKLVSETLTGQTLEKARVTAKEVIEKINKDAGEVLIKPTEEQINRFANDIVKAALEMNGVITSDQVIAAYNAAYRSAGLSVGHEPNNFFSRMIVGESAKIEGNINNAIKEKNWSNATWLTYYSIFFRNLLNPFAGGGTNWLVIKLEKTGLGLFTGLMYEKSGRKEAMDLSTKEGLARLEKRLFNESRAKDSYLRGLVGGTASLLVFAAFNGAPDDWEEKYKKWRLENKWAAKYLDLITPEMLLAQMAIDAQKTNKRAILQYAATSLNKNDALSAEEKLFKAVDYAAQGDSPRAYGALGEALGARINTPLPWRLVRDGQILYQGIKGEDPYHGNYKPSIGFWSGVLQGGAIEWAGLRPVYEGNVDVSYFKVKDPETRKEREITEKERIGVRDLANRRYAALMNEYKRGEKGIWRDINNKLHISKKSQSGSETVTWREVGYKNLNKEDIRTLEDLIRKQSLNDAKKEFQFDRGAVAQ